MVIAELPLWVTHRDVPSSSTNRASDGRRMQPTSEAAASATNSNDDNDDKNGDGGIVEDPRAYSSLALLQDHRSKCAIYSVDLHPYEPKFATAGGDGTVRLWSTATLFAAHHQGGRFDEQAGYISTSEEDDHDNNDNNNDEENDQDDTSNGTEEEPSLIRRKRHLSSTGSSRRSNRDVVSISENDDDDDDDDDDDNKDEEKDDDPMEIGQKDPDKEDIGSVEFNDLNQLVRRKQSGSKKKPTTTTHKTTQSTDSAAIDQSRHKMNSTSSSGSRNNNSSKKKNNNDEQRLLCTLSAHTGSSVLCVRWSSRGKYLASAGDDGCVCIYAQSSTTTNLGISGNLVNHHGDNKKNLEPWSRILLCRGHNLDVVGLAWAPDDSHLASCSLDRETPIIIWKLNDLANGNIPEAHQRIRQPYKVLGTDVHTSNVKGVTFDPAGSYLASSGDDPAICIWRAHDDWGLEKRIDASNGIFRQWKENDSLSMSAQSIFRRISWSTDGSFICSTNSVVKNKHVASTIARDGWTVATDKNQTAGAATLVGHKQPIVVSRHASQWLDVSKPKNKEGDGAGAQQDFDDDDEEPEYATLLALGDKSGFVTVWSTRKSKPVFKLQCSESRSTVTDLAWGKRSASAHMMLLISLLDGQIVAAQFHVPKEIGPLLSDEGQAKVFQLRYGIYLQEGGDDDDDATRGGAWHTRRSNVIVGERTGPQMIENAFQMSLERKAISEKNKPEEDSVDEERNSDLMDDEPIQAPDIDDDESAPLGTDDSASAVKSRQLESQSRGGKKRVQPVLVSGSGTSANKQARMASAPRESAQTPKLATDALQDALEAANRAETVTTARGIAAKRATPPRTQEPAPQAPPPLQHPRQQQQLPTTPVGLAPSKLATILPHSTERIHSIDLPCQRMLEATSGLTGDCTNSRGAPVGSRAGSTAISCIDLSISRNGSVIWRDEIPGTACTATSASPCYWAVGTSDGSIQLYGTSPSMGWECGQAFRIMAPLILGNPIVELHLQEQDSEGTGASSSSTNTIILAIIGDGSFFVLGLGPEPSLLYKGSILPAMNNVLLGLPADTSEHLTPRLSKAHITKQGNLTVLISLHMSTRARVSSGSSSGGRAISSESPRNKDNNKRVRNNMNHPTVDHGVGGSIQGFVYSRTLELWTRMSDSRFLCSDYYQMLPASLSSKRKKLGPLAELDNSVRMGTLGSSLKPAGRTSSESALILYSRATAQEEEDENGNYSFHQNFIPTRSHCEDRIACALQLGSAREVRQWLLKYIKVLILGGHEATLRVVIDMILHGRGGESAHSSGTGNVKSFISSAIDLLGVDPAVFIRDQILREMGMNRSLQRLATEVQLEVNNT